MLNIQESDEGLRIEVKVQPRSSRNQISGEQEGALKVKLTAPPVEGEANQALVNFLSRLLKLPRKNIILIRGETTRNKLIEIRGISKEQLLQTLGVQDNM
ncbi:MAG: DUF167 domain-containing protein [Syntrophomonadaceae bacterium]|nr:DUF167 domain-containing protein [Syntrophomonadaceae bacterium]MDD3270928.1 DUF167 domain-containing protein [Syntrophomonadaceae bacterium]MDD3897473.1 DUF167 domain-containing protein [Syntrophomonadaceae bacterium]MDD4561947.1 DUF167 domain-containing protein [Syntrophomonadaceae bacterium]